MKLFRKLWRYREYHGSRFDWKIGNLEGDDPQPGGTIQASIEWGHVGHFDGYDPTKRAWTSSSVPMWNSIDVALCLWKWGIFAAVRTTEVPRG